MKEKTIFGAMAVLLILLMAIGFASATSADINQQNQASTTARAFEFKLNAGESQIIEGKEFKLLAVGPSVARVSYDGQLRILVLGDSYVFPNMKGTMDLIEINFAKWEVNENIGAVFMYKRFSDLNTQNDAQDVVSVSTPVVVANADLSNTQSQSSGLNFENAFLIEKMIESLKRQNMGYVVISSDKVTSKDLKLLFNFASSDIRYTVDSQQKSRRFPASNIVVFEDSSRLDIQQASTVAVYLQQKYGDSSAQDAEYVVSALPIGFVESDTQFDFSKLDKQVTLVISNNKAVIVVGKNLLDTSKLELAGTSVIVPVQPDCSWVNVGSEFISEIGEQTKFVLKEDGRKPTDCSSAAGQSFAKFFLEKVWQGHARVTISVAGNNGGIYTKELRIGEQIKMGENHVLVFTSTNGVNSGKFVVKRTTSTPTNSQYADVEVFEEYICPVGCKEIAEGCLCPKVRVSRSGQGYSVDVSGLTVNTKKLTFLPGAESIVAETEEGVSEDISAYNLANEGLDVDVVSEDSVNTIRVYSDKNRLETRLVDAGVSVKTREIISASKKGLTVEISGNERLVKVLPSVASERAKEVLAGNFDELELKEVGNNLVYSASEEKEYKVFGFIPARVQVSAKINAETGEVSVSKPWFSGISVESNK